MHNMNEFKEFLYKQQSTIKLTAKLLEHLPASIVMLDKDLNLKIWSKKFADEFFPKDENFNPNVSSLNDINHYLAESIRKKDKIKLSMEGSTFKDQIGINGHSRIFIYEMAPWIVDDIVAGVIIVFNNITSLTNELLDKFDLVSKFTNDGMMLLDENNKTLMINDQLENMLGLTKKNVIGKYINQIFEEQQFNNRNINDILNVKFKKSESYLNMNFNAVSISDNNGKYFGTLARVNF